MDPEKKEPGNEQREKLETADALLNPTFENSGMLYKKIDEEIYTGEKDYAARRGKIEACGYDSDDMAKIGQGIRTEYADLYERIKIKEATPDDKTRFNHLQGLIFSKTDAGETDYAQHSDISIGLAHELVRQMRKVNNFLAQPETDGKTIKKIFGERKSNPAQEEAIDRALNTTKKEFEDKKKAALAELLTINSPSKAAQYETAFNVLESAIQPQEPSFSNKNREGVMGRVEFSPDDILAEEIRQHQEDIRKKMDLASAAEEGARLRKMISQKEQAGQQPNAEEPEPKNILPQKKRGFFGRMFGKKE